MPQAPSNIQHPTSNNPPPTTSSGGGILGAWLRVDPPPAEGAEKTNQCAQADSPGPAEPLADQRRYHGRQQTNAVATGIHDGGGRPAAVPAELHGCSPERTFAQTQNPERERQQQDDPE